MDLTQVQFLNSSEVINASPDEYWTLVMDIARRNNLKRILRCSQIMGRTESDDLSAAQIMYPCMQCADIFFLKVGGGDASAFTFYFYVAFSGSPQLPFYPSLPPLCPFCTQHFCFQLWTAVLTFSVIVI